ncbi:MAG TPA: hypothetical protein VGO61_19255 [Steroidobacteraceae bacterium]|nr:hypothetical protein [Steroidobacteraceae bacterium]
MDMSITRKILRITALIASGSILHLGTANATPAVSGVSGTVSHGSSITISGSGFGTRANNNSNSDSWQGGNFLMFRFKDFEDGQINSHGFYAQKGDSPWSPSSSELGIQNGGPVNSTKYIKRSYVTDEAGGLSANVSGSSNQLYTTFKFMMPANTQSGKLFRFYATSPMNDVYLSSGCTNNMVRGFSECTSGTCSGAATEWGTGPALTANQWHRIEVWADASKNQFTVWVNGTQAWTKSNWLNSSLMMNGHTLDYPNMLDSSSRDASCPATGSYNYDDIYADFTQARVEISDAATWSASRTKEIQIATAWSDSSISVRVNSGQFTAGRSAYLYVVDANGTANSQGIPVTIGGSAGTPPPPVKTPKPPTGVN